MEISQATSAAPSVRWSWIADRSSDLIWYIGSAGVGWLYLALAVGIGSQLTDPASDPLFYIKIGSTWVGITLTHLVYTTWAIGLDSPHLFATLARTFADPDERATRSRALWLSWLWFAAGPVTVLLPYLIGAVVPLPRFALALGGLAFDVFFRLWAYYHVVRQHWGFLALYRRKAGEAADAEELTADAWFFNAVMYLPVLMLLTAPWYGETRFPPLGFQVPLLSGWSLAQILRGPVLATYGVATLGYIAYQVLRWSKGSPRNGSKLLFLASVVPLHLLAFASPLTVLFLLPIVTVGHNLQYHRIVWGYGTTKYRAADPVRFRAAQTIFSSVWLYGALGLLFTLACYHGPWVDWISDKTADALDTGLAGLASLAGVKNPSALNLGDRVVGWFVMGWAMQHYYLDARIWRVGSDKAVARVLNVAT